LVSCGHCYEIAMKALNQSSRLPKVVLLAAVIVAAVATVFYWQMHRQPKPQEPSLSDARKPASVPFLAAADANEPWRKCVASVKTATSPADRRAVLDDFRARLASMPPGAASRLIRDLLDSKEDLPTQLGFTVGADGLLTQAPSLRTFLLNELARLDPAAAAAYAEKILTTMNSADEWALALRSYALGNTTPQGRAFLEDKLRTMLTHEPWQTQPSAGFLEAFDVAVYVGGTNLLPVMTGLVRLKENQAVAHAAFLALDRLTISDPVAVLTQLQGEDASMAGREQTRANYFARADAGDARQRALLENYLLNPQLSAAELKTFAGLYPNANYMISYNLLTRTETPSHDELVRRDRDALNAVQGWLADARFEKLQPQLQTMSDRLTKFVKQGGAR